MEKRFLQWLGFGFAALALLALAVSLIRDTASIVDSHAKGGDLATWVGAVGTVGTLIGTIILATTETRRKRQQEMALAVLTIAGLRHKLIDAGIAIKMLNEWIGSIQRATYTDNARNLHQTQIQKLDLWTNADLVPLAVLPGKVAVHLAEVIGDIKQISDSLNRDSFAYTVRVDYHFSVFKRNVGEALEKLQSVLFKTVLAPPEQNSGEVDG